MKPLISIALVFRKLDDYTLTCIKKCIQLNYDNYEIVLCPDEKISHPILKNKKITAIKPTGISDTFAKGKLTIPQKRNISLSICNPKTKYYAFVDDDAYPVKDWLKNAVETFEKRKNVGAVGGPNLTPREDPILQRVTGNAMQSKLCYGKGFIRHKVVEAHYVNELPTCNLIVEKEAMDKVGGFDDSQPTGEDAKLCTDILAIGKKIYYSPDVKVYHHRRVLFKPFIKQFYLYGLFKARLFKKDKMSSLHYLTPGVFVLGFIGGAILSLFFPIVFLLFLVALSLYFLLLLFESVRESAEFEEVPLTMLAMLIMQFSYGIGFLAGLILV